MLTKAKFILNPAPREPRMVGLVPCGHCSCCRLGYIQPATEFTFLSGRGKWITWVYNRYFSCNSRNVVYAVICIKTPHTYVGKTVDTTQRCRKHASDVRHPHNSNCRKCAEHMRECSNQIEPYFRMYPFYYVDNDELRHLVESRFIKRW